MAKQHNPDSRDESSAENVVPISGREDENPAIARDAAALAEQLTKLLAEKRELTDTLVRRQADFENYRKRIERERVTEHHRGIEALIESLLPVMDGFERALAAHGDPGYENYRKGFELIYRQLENTLSKKGLELIDAEGKPFDPHLHHAVERIESTDYPDGTVVGVMQNGYMFHGKVLRPAMVRVTANSRSEIAQAN